MDKLDKLPEPVKKGLIDFLSFIPAEKHSVEWRGIQVAIAMILAPNSFRDKVHVHLSSREGAHEEGYFNEHKMSIRIWPHKIQMSRIHQVWSSRDDYTQNEHHRYIFPSEKYSIRDFYNLMSDTSGLFKENYHIDNSDASGVCYCSSNYTIDTNVK